MRPLLNILLLITIFVSNLYTQEIKKVSLQLQWKHQFEFAGFYIAKEKGYYKDIGLEVELKEFNSDVNITDDVVSEKTTFGVNYPNIIYEKANGKDVVILNAILQSSPHVLLSLESSGINSIQDFKGRTIMSSHDALTAAPFISMLQKNKLSFDDLKTIPHTFDMNDIIEGKADIVNVFTSNEPFKLKQQGIQYKIWDPRDYGFDFYDVILFTSANQLKKDPQMVAEFNEASLKGWEYAFSHIEETVDLIFEKYNTQNKTKEALLFEANTLKELAYYKTDTLGKIDPHKIERIFDIYNLLGYTKKAIDIDQFIYHKNNISLTKEEKKYLQSLDVVKVFAIDNNEPISYIDHANPTGYANELFKIVAQKLGLKIQWIKDMSYGEALTALQNGEIDIKSVYSHFRTSRDFVVPSSSIISAPFTVVGRFDSKNINSINDLKGKRLVLVKGYQQTLTIEQDYPEIEFKTVDNINEAYSFVRSAEADYYIDQSIHSSYYIREKLLSDIKVAGELPQSEIGQLNLYFGINSSMPLLHSSIQKALASIEENTIRELKTKWLISNKDSNLILTQQEKQYLKNKEFLTVCVQPNWLPYEGMKNGQFIGINADYLYMISEKINKPLKIITGDTTQEVIEQLKRGKCDIKPVAVDGKGNLPYKPTLPNIEDSIAIVTKIEEPFVSNLNKHIDKKFIVLKNRTRLIKYIKKAFPKINLIEVDSIDQALDMILEGEVFGLFGKTKSMAYHVYKYYPTQLKIINEFEKISTGIGVVNNDPILFSIMEKTLKSIGEKEALKIANKWDITTIETKPDYTILWYVFIVFLIVTVVFIINHVVLKRANDKLQEEKDRFERQKNFLDTLIQTLPIPLFSKDIEGKYIIINDKFSEFTGYSKEEIIGKSVFDIAPKHIADIYHAQDLKVINLEENPQVYESKVINKNTTDEYEVLFYKSAFFDEHNNVQGIIGSVVDLSQQRQLEKERIEQQKILLEQLKLVAMGEMIGNIAHQWRQPLSVISTGATGLKLQKEYDTLTDENFISTCDMINDNAQYLSKTIDDFRDFIKGDRNIVEFNLLKNVESFLHLVEGSIKNNNIKVVKDIDENIRVHGYPNELIQCFINIFNNAKDALKDKEHEKLIFISTELKEDKVNIIFRDNAGGIDEDILQHIFEPYFTTKHQNQGTGLGLHMTFNLIVDGMGGSIKAKTVSYTYEQIKYTGAEFVITLSLN